jgi:hypothetical protein
MPGALQGAAHQIHGQAVVGQALIGEGWPGVADQTQMLGRNRRAVKQCDQQDEETEMVHADIRRR